MRYKIFTVAIAASMIFGGILLSLPNSLNTGLIAYYNFNSTTDGKLQDLSGKNNHGTLLAPAQDGKFGGLKAYSCTGRHDNCPKLTTNRFNKADSAYSFNGWGAIFLDDLSTKSNIYFDGKIANRTINFWYVYSPKGVSQTATIFEEGGGVNGLHIYLESKSETFHKVVVGAWSKDNNWDGAWLGVQTTPEQWHMVTLVFGGTPRQLQLYHDGKFIKAVKVPVEIAPHVGGDAIGAYNGATRTKENLFKRNDSYDFGFMLKGKLDEGRIYNRVLTGAEILSLYQDNQ